MRGQGVKVAAVMRVAPAVDRKPWRVSVANSGTAAVMTTPATRTPPPVAASLIRVEEPASRFHKGKFPPVPLFTKR